MVGQVLKYVATYCLGFCSGVIYTSNKYGQNPNDIFNDWKNNTKDVAISAKDKCKDGINNIKEKMKKKDDIEVVDAEIVEE